MPQAPARAASPQRAQALEATGSVNSPGCFVIPAVTAAIWFGEPSSWTWSSDSSRSASAAGAFRVSASGGWPGRVGSGDFPAIRGASSRAAASGSAAVRVTRPSEAASAPSKPSEPIKNVTAPAPQKGDQRFALTKDIQRELHRGGCYAGDIDGEWNAQTRQAMKNFVDRVNAIEAGYIETPPQVQIIDRPGPLPLIVLVLVGLFLVFRRYGRR